MKRRGDWDIPWRVVLPLGMFAVLPEVGYLHFEFWVIEECQKLGHSRWGCWWEYLGSTPGLLFFGGGVIGFLVLLGVIYFGGWKDEDWTTIEGDDV